MKNFACYAGVAIACSLSGMVGIAFATCTYTCKKVRAHNHTTYVCRVFDPIHCFNDSVWTPAGGVAGPCRTADVDVPLNAYGCDQGCTDLCPGKSGYREYTGPTDFVMTCTNLGLVNAFVKECTGGGI